MPTLRTNMVWFTPIDGPARMMIVQARVPIEDADELDLGEKIGKSPTHVAVPYDPDGAPGTWRAMTVDDMPKGKTP